jgi:hypothetical protein
MVKPPPAARKSESLHQWSADEKHAVLLPEPKTAAAKSN